MANVMIVEDSQSAAAAHAYSLWEYGHTVTFAYSAREAREAFESCQHDVVLLDFDLPDGTGLEVFRALRQVDPGVCVVMVTGKGNECVASQILKEGAKDYLTKSSELLSILPEVVDRVLREKETVHQLGERDQALKEARNALQHNADELAEVRAKLEHEIRMHAETAAALAAAREKLKHFGAD